MSQHPTPAIPPPPTSFAPTRWTIVLAAAEGSDDSRSRQALEQLAQLYWFPLYAFLRRQGYPAPEAEDLTQGFFAHLIEKAALRTVHPEKGKFRSFLLASLKHFVANDREKRSATKRGGALRILPLESAEARYTRAPADDQTPERVFEQRWAWTLLDQVLLRLRQHYRDQDQEPLFEALKPALTAESALGSHGQLAAALGMSEGAVTVAIHRLRKRYRELLRDEIAQTVSDPALVDEEITYLLQCL